VLIDGSDYRVEHDTVADGLAFKGWNGSAA